MLDTAITATYARAGITDDPTTWTRPAPLLADLRATLHDLAHHPTRSPRGPASGTGGDAVGERADGGAVGGAAAPVHRRRLPGTVPPPDQHPPGIASGGVGAA